MATALGLHEDAQVAQVSNVAADRTDIDVQPVGWLTPGEPGVRLEQFQPD